MYGVMQVKVAGAWKTKHVHTVVACCRENEVIDTKLYDVSHLCHNSLCINEEHLSVEPHFVNNNRRACTEKNKCISHDPYPQCKLDLKQ